MLPVSGIVISSIIFLTIIYVEVKLLYAKPKVAKR